MFFKRLSSFVIRAVIAAALAIGASDLHAQEGKPTTPELKVSVAVGPAFALGAAAAQWSKRIAEKSEARLGAKLFPGALLAQGDPAREFIALHDGAADLAIISSLYAAIQVKPLGAVGLPWLAADPPQVAMLTSGAIADRLLSALDASGVVPLALAPLASRAIAVRQRSIQTPADFAGAKVRITNVPLLTQLYGALGAQPMTMAFADAQKAFADGTLDLQDGTPASFATAHLDAVGVNQVILWGATAEIAIFAANRARWDALTDAERTLLRDTARDAAKELAMSARQENDAALAALRNSGMTVTRLPPQQRVTFATATRALYTTLASDIGEALVRAAEAAVAGSEAGR